LGTLPEDFKTLQQATVYHRASHVVWQMNSSQQPMHFLALAHTLDEHLIHCRLGSGGTVTHKLPLNESQT
jgi:hypothetical protein